MCSLGKQKDKQVCLNNLMAELQCGLKQLLKAPALAPMLHTVTLSFIVMLSSYAFIVSLLLGLLLGVTSERGK